MIAMLERATALDHFCCFVIQCLEYFFGKTKQGHDVCAAFSDKWNPALSTTCALDEHDEIQVTNRLEALAPRRVGVPVVSAEHDGATFLSATQQHRSTRCNVRFLSIASVSKLLVFFYVVS